MASIWGNTLVSPCPDAVHLRMGVGFVDMWLLRGPHGPRVTLRGFYSSGDMVQLARIVRRRTDPA